LVKGRDRTLTSPGRGFFFGRAVKKGERGLSYSTKARSVEKLPSFRKTRKVEKRKAPFKPLYGRRRKKGGGSQISPRMFPKKRKKGECPTKKNGVQKGGKRRPCPAKKKPSFCKRPRGTGPNRQHRGAAVRNPAPLKRGDKNLLLEKGKKTKGRGKGRETGGTFKGGAKSQTKNPSPKFPLFRN